jgi:hypothetical protein
MSRQGRLASWYPIDDLNQVNNDLLELVGDEILIEAEYKAGKEVQIQLTKAVALEFKRGTINAAQKAGRRSTKTTAMLESSNDDDSSNSKSDSEDSNTKETELARAPPARPRRQLFKKSKPAPARKHQGQVSRVLKKGKGKAVQKQGECKEVHGEPRKLRSMK